MPPPPNRSGSLPTTPALALAATASPSIPFYLTWKAREYGLNTRFIELAGEINTAMPDWVIGKVMNALNDRGQDARMARSVLVLGIAYKKNVDDMRESPSVMLMDKLIKKGAIVEYSDPYVPVFPKMRAYSFDHRSVELSEQTLGSFDCVLIATNHDVFDYDMIRQHARLIVDTRGVYRGNYANVVSA